MIEFKRALNVFNSDAEFGFKTCVSSVFDTLTGRKGFEMGKLPFCFANEKGDF